MSRPISRTFKILFFSLIFCGIAEAYPGASAPNVKISALIQKASRSQLIALLGAKTLSDSTIQIEHGQSLNLLLFEPVPFEGVPALMEALISHDSVAKIEVYLPYIGHPDTRLKLPFELGDFVRSSQEDYDQIERKVEDELGIPTVMTGTNFEYIEGNSQPVFGVFENGMVHITIMPGHHPLPHP